MGHEMDCHPLGAAAPSRTSMKLLNLSSSVFLLAFAAVLHAQTDDPAAQIAAFSSISRDDIGKAIHGDLSGKCVPIESLPWCLSMETCYVAPVAPPAFLERLRANDQDSQVGASSQTFDTEVTRGISTPPQVLDFKRLYLNPALSHTKWLLQKGKSKGADPYSLNLNKEEAARVAKACEQAIAQQTPDWMASGAFAISDVWKEILCARAALFQQGGLAMLPSCEKGKEVFVPEEEMKAVFEGRPRIAAEFQDVLPWLMNGKAPADMDAPPVHYWSLSKIYNHGNLSLSMLGSAKAPNGFRAFEVEYYVCSQYYLSLILYRIWPIEQNGAPATLVWRGDYVLLPDESVPHGMEKMATERIMLLEIKQTIRKLIADLHPKRS